MAPKAFKQKKYQKPQEPHIVIFNPWGMPNHNRIQLDVNALGAWLRFMFRGLGQPSCVVEAVYTMNTRTEVIVSLSPTVDIVPVLGAHEWWTFLKQSFLEAPSTEASLKRWGNVLSEKYLYSVRLPDVRASGISTIFEYNWERCGDPSKHQWEAHHPIPDDPPEWMNFPVLRDYPDPSWVLPPSGLQSNSRCLLLPLPTPPPAEAQDEQQASSNSEPLKLEVKSESQGQDQVAGGSKKVKEEQAEETTPFQKQDPYEEESATRRSLFDTASSDIKVEPRDVKVEPGVYQALRQAIEQQQLDMNPERIDRSLAPGSSSTDNIKKERIDNLTKTVDPRKRHLTSNTFEASKRIKREA